MRIQAFLPILALCAALAGCATTERPKPLGGADVVQLAREGRSAKEIIEELRRTDTVLPLQASDIVALHEAGVPNEVLDYLQQAQIEEMRWRDRYSRMYMSPTFRGFGPCPWPPSSVLRPYRGGLWGC